MVKKYSLTPQKENFYFSIVSYIHKYQKLPKQQNPIFSNYPKIKHSNNYKQLMNYHIRKLKALNIITKVSTGVWEADIDKLDQERFKNLVKTTPRASKTSKKKANKNDIRGHGFIISFKLPKIKGWNKENRIKRYRSHYVNVGTNNCGERIIIRKHKVHIYPKSIVIYSPKGESYFSHKAKTSKGYALYDLHQILKSVENLFNLSFKFKEGYKFKVSRQHYAQIDNELANQYTREGKKLICSYKGKEWLIVDKSYVAELETTNKDTSDIDQDDIIQPFFNSLKKHYESTGEAVTIENLMKLFVSMAKSQQETNQNIESLKNKLESFTNNFN